MQSDAVLITSQASTSEASIPITMLEAKPSPSIEEIPVVDKPRIIMSATDITSTKGTLQSSLSSPLDLTSRSHEGSYRVFTPLKKKSVVTSRPALDGQGQYQLAVANARKQTIVSHFAQECDISEKSLYPVKDSTQKIWADVRSLVMKIR
eukprot:Tbor_TRINITY_DN3267_c0_g1::TRINITY_DN3267_c0_g1_i1::g.23728::m.23728